MIRACSGSLSSRKPGHDVAPQYKRQVMARRPVTRQHAGAPNPWEPSRIMQGSPPPACYQVHDDNRFAPAVLPWLQKHMRELMPTHGIRRGDHLSVLPAVPMQIEGTRFIDALGSPGTLGDLMHHPHTEAVLIVHRDSLVTEHYAAGMSAKTSFRVASLSRTFIGFIVGMLVKQGLLELDAPAGKYVPELSDGGYASATVRHLLDMRSGVTSSVLRTMEVLRWSEPSSANVPDGVYAQLLALRQDTDPGGPFKYRCCDSDMLAWICERATQKRFADLVSEKIWARGMEYDADMVVDRHGAAFASGGLCASPRDLARFGQMLLHPGELLPAGWDSDTRFGSADARSSFGGKMFDVPMPRGMYRNQTWVPDTQRGATLGFGAHGQLLYVDPSAELICVVLSAWPLPQMPILADWLKAFEALANSLMDIKTGR